MKRIVGLILFTVMAFSLVACGNKNKTPKEEVGQGEISIVLPKTTSNDNKHIVAFSEENKQLQMGLNSKMIDDSRISYIFVDGKQIRKVKLGYAESVIDLSQDLPKDAGKNGKHKIELIQFNKDKTDGNIMVYKFVEYECKNK